MYNFSFVIFEESKDSSPAISLKVVEAMGVKFFNVFNLGWDGLELRFHNSDATLPQPIIDKINSENASGYVKDLIH